MCNAVSGATLAFPFPSRFEASATPGLTAAFRTTVRQFTIDAYVENEPEPAFADFPEAALELSDVVPADRADLQASSGKTFLRAPEPPAVLMVFTGAGLMSLSLRRRRPVHRPGRRKTRDIHRAMAKI